MSKKQVTLLLALLSATNISHIYASETSTDKIEKTEKKQKMDKNPYLIFMRAGFYAGAMTLALVAQSFCYDKAFETLMGIELLKSLEKGMPYILGAILVGVVSFAIPFIEDMVCGCDKKE